MLPSCKLLNRGMARHSIAQRMHDVQTEYTSINQRKWMRTLKVRPLAHGIFVYVLDMTQHSNRQNRCKSVFAG